jgi:hypothetical protein
MLEKKQIEQLKKKANLRKKVEIDESSMMIGDFKTYGMITNSCFYIYSDINTSKKKFEENMLNFTFLYWEEVSKNKGLNKLLVSPTIYNYFMKDGVFKKNNYQMVSSNHASELQDIGIWQVNTYHWYKNIVVDEKEHGKKNSLILDIRKYINEVANKEPRTKMSITGFEELVFHFHFRNTKIDAKLEKDEKSYYFLCENKKYPLKTKKQIENSVSEILQASYNKKRVEFIIDPPKYCFHMNFSFIDNHEMKEKLYDLLRKTMDFNEIEDKCFAEKTKHYRYNDQLTIFTFDGKFYLIEEGSLHVYEKENENKAKERMEELIIKEVRNKTLKKLKNVHL